MIVTNIYRKVMTHLRNMHFFHVAFRRLCVLKHSIHKNETTKY